MTTLLLVLCELFWTKWGYVCKFPAQIDTCLTCNEKMLYQAKDSRRARAVERGIMIQMMKRMNAGSRGYEAGDEEVDEASRPHDQWADLGRGARGDNGEW